MLKYIAFFILRNLVYKSPVLVAVQGRRRTYYPVIFNTQVQLA
jgi:hypothetical protein